MAGLQRSAQTFRRSGSSGLVWDERFLTEGGAGGEDTGSVAPRPQLRHSRSVGSAGMLLRRGGGGGDDDEPEHDDKKRRLALALAKPKEKEKEKKEKDGHRRQEPGRKAFRTRDVAPAADPPSPRVSGCCAPCAIFRGAGAGGSSARGARGPSQGTGRRSAMHA
ncbi:hypothetical protein ACP4OV_009315 [Aristida adscensionis]